MAKTRTSFKKGEIHNPNGRPLKEWTWSSLIRSAMEKENLDGEQIKIEVANVLVAKAMEGDVQALKELGNRLDGLPAQTQILKGDKENPLQMEYIEFEKQ